MGRAGSSRSRDRTPHPKALRSGSPDTSRVGPSVVKWMQHGPPSPSSNPGGLASAVREERCVDGEVGAGHRRPQRLQPLDAAPTLSPISPIAQRSILNLASGAIRGNPLGVHYSASKGGGVSMTPALARHGIRVNAIAPGLTDAAQPRYGNSEAELAENEGPQRSASTRFERSSRAAAVPRPCPAWSESSDLTRSSPADP